MTTTSVPTETYLFERRSDLGDLESRRLHAIADLFDPATRRLLAQVGVARGWRCLEVAAGTGSVAAWLADQVGPEGEVFATDIDLTHLVELPPNVTYAQHDIVTDSLPEGAFDVVHTRLLLEHLSGRETALNRMASAVRPGGYVVVEEAEMSPQALDLITRYHAPAARSSATRGCGPSRGCSPRSAPTWGMRRRCREPSAGPGSSSSAARSTRRSSAAEGSRTSVG